MISRVCSYKSIAWLSDGAQGLTVCPRDDKSLSEKCNGLSGTPTCASLSVGIGPLGSMPYYSSTSWNSLIQPFVNFAVKFYQQ